MQYPDHDAFVAPARAQPKIGWLLVGLILIFAIYALGFVVLFGVLWAVAGLEGAQNWMQLMAQGGTPTATLLILATFIGMGLGPIVVARYIHGRSGWTLFGPFRPMMRDFAIAFAICAGLYVLLLLIPTDTAPIANIEVGLWAAFLPMALAGILIQTGAEEVLFRGYLQQQLAARFASPVMWMVLPSALFAVAHYQPEVMGPNAWIVVLAVGLFAILAADLTAVTGNIGAAWGFHFANNCVGILIVAMDGPLSGLALYTAPFDPSNIPDTRPLLFFDMATTLFTWGLIRYAVTRRRH